jgi:hypothetical protein
MYNFTKEELLELLNNVYEAGCYGFADLKEAEVEKFLSECEKYKPENLPFPPYNEASKGNMTLNTATTTSPPWANSFTPNIDWNVGPSNPVSAGSPPPNVDWNVAAFDPQMSTLISNTNLDEETIRMINNAGDAAPYNGGQVTIIASDDSKGTFSNNMGDFVVTINQENRSQPSQPYPFSLELPPPSPSVVVICDALGSQRNTTIH